MFKFAASEAGKKFYSIDSEVQILEDRSASSSTEEYQKLEGKLKHDLAGEKLGSDWGVISLVIFLNIYLMMVMMFHNKAMVDIVAPLPEFLHSYYRLTFFF